MNTEEIDKWCDLFEAQLQGNRELTVDQFLEEQGLSRDRSLVAELQRLVSDYSQTDMIGAGAIARVGSSIGPYKLLQQIGEGGMGVVFVAQQNLPVRRRVALKVIKPGMDTREVILRFEAERQALAMMEHEYIAKILDGGATEDGRPYFVMELVRGLPITQFCDDNKFTLRQRLELFVFVCQAVQHAHQRGIIHRDLKPANVLVRYRDGQPVPKVIDFGVAKAIGQQLTDKTLFTEFGRVVGTLQYMSPEQAASCQLDVDTRSDIYSLGAMLYELLTGTTPIERQRLREEGWEGVLRLIRDADPPKPSTRVHESGGTISTISERRQIDPRTLVSSVKGDLDWIVMKAIEKDRSRRYESANELARDIQRHINHDAVEARPPTWTYKASRFARRHRISLCIATGFVVVLVAVASAVTWIERNRQVMAEAKRMVNGLITASEADVLSAAKELQSYLPWARHDLESLVAGNPTTQHERKQQLHARLALVPGDSIHVAPLLESLLTATPKYVGVIRDALHTKSELIVSKLWKEFHSLDSTALPDRRFRAGMALALYDPPVTRSRPIRHAAWHPDDFQFLAEHLLTENPRDQPDWLAYLRPVGGQCIRHWERRFGQETGKETQLIGAANALAEFVKGDQGHVVELLARANPDQYKILYPLIESEISSQARNRLAKIVAEQPAGDCGWAPRVALGRRRAGAAITLLRLGALDRALSVFDFADDPESMTQFLHGCRGRGVPLAEVLELMRATSVQPYGKPPYGLSPRLSKHELTTGRGAGARRVFFARYALLLTLGDYPLRTIAESERQPLVDQIADWYRNDPSSAIHGAAGWVLRQWGQEETVRKVDSTPVDYSPDREWFTLAIRIVPGRPESRVDQGREKIAEMHETTFYFTFIVFPQGDYVIGTPRDDPDRMGIEVQHTVTFARPFAILDREVTFAEWLAFRPEDSRIMNGIPGYTAVPTDAAFGPSWYDAVDFCRWLGTQARLPEDDQAYPDVASLGEQEYPRETNPKANWAPRNWPVYLDRHGFRLPTEAEWESACRAGMRTSYCQGSDVNLLGNYAWFLDNSGKRVHPPKTRRPGLQGLFDMHGNLFEWCHDWKGPYDSGKAADPMGPAEGSIRVARSSSWFDAAAVCRSSMRSSGDPAGNDNRGGFRLALTLSSKANQRDAR